MESYFPHYPKDLNSKAEGVRKFLAHHFPDLNWEVYKTSKGSYCFTAYGTEESRISVFVVKEDGTDTMQLFWMEKAPSTRQMSVKIPIDNEEYWVNGLGFILGAIPVFSDPDLYTAQYSDDDLKDNIVDILHAGKLYGALLDVKGDRGEEDDEAEEGEITSYEKKPDQIELRNMVDAALDRRDMDEFFRLSAMLESNNSMTRKFRRIHGFNDFL